MRRHFHTSSILTAKFISEWPISTFKLYALTDSPKVLKYVLS